jgi:hypothetical protein
LNKSGKLIIIAVLFSISSSSFSQNFRLKEPVFRQNNFFGQNYVLNNTGSNANSYLFIGSLVVLFTTPTFIYEDNKVYFGLGRELSLTFGKKGEFRLSAEYTFIFRSSLKHHFRASAKYDMLSNLTETEWISEREFVSIGAGYFIDEGGNGIFPEVAVGYRIGGDGSIIYFYPYMKLRHTFMLKKDKPDNTDFSLGMAIGFKPF